MALSIDNNDGLSHTVMGLVQTHLRNWDVAGMHLKNALNLNPNSVLFADKYANWLLRVGRTEEALQTLDAALERDPLQPPWYWEVRTMALLREKRYDEAIYSINHKNPLQSWDHVTLAIAHAYLGNVGKLARKQRLPSACNRISRFPDMPSPPHTRTRLISKNDRGHEEGGPARVERRSG